MLTLFKIERDIIGYKLIAKYKVQERFKAQSQNTNRKFEPPYKLVHMWLIRDK